MQTRFAVSLAAQFLLALSSGCATYEVRDVYHSKAPAPEYEAEGVLVRAWVNRETLFHSVGPIGLPIIPTVFGSPQTRLSVTLVLHLNKDAMFSFDAQPCLRVSASQHLCPEEAEISAVAMWRDDGSQHGDRLRRSHWLPEFSRKPHLLIGLEAQRSKGRITKQDIYAHYGYSGAHWDHLHVNVIYHYTCAQTCPAVFDLDMRDLAILDGTTPLEGTAQFVRSREKEYRPWAGNPG
jgi:hypothetical protein